MAFLQFSLPCWRSAWHEHSAQLSGDNPFLLPPAKAGTYQQWLYRCQFCSKHFRSQEGWQQLKQKRVSQVAACHICRKGFSSRQWCWDTHKMCVRRGGGLNLRSAGLNSVNRIICRLVLNEDTNCQQNYIQIRICCSVARCGNKLV